MLKLKLQTLATWYKEPTHWNRPWCWERLEAGGEGDDRGWDGCVASQTQRTWVWARSRRWWWTWKPGMLQLKGWQRVGHDWATEQQTAPWLEGGGGGFLLSFGCFLVCFALFGFVYFGGRQRGLLLLDVSCHCLHATRRTKICITVSGILCARNSSKCLVTYLIFKTQENEI